MADSDSARKMLHRSNVETSIGFDSTEFLALQKCRQKAQQRAPQKARQKQGKSSCPEVFDGKFGIYANDAAQINGRNLDWLRLRRVPGCHPQQKAQQKGWQK